LSRGAHQPRFGVAQISCQTVWACQTKVGAKAGRFCKQAQEGPKKIEGLDGLVGVLRPFRNRRPRNAAPNPHCQFMEPLDVNQWLGGPICVVPRSGYRCGLRPGIAGLRIISSVITAVCRRMWLEELFRVWTPGGEV
jgi:hypothetical protein